MLYSILYASRSLIDPADRSMVIDQLLAEAARCTQECGITGALICSGGWFAQVLEGARPQLDTLLERIDADPRHGDVVTLEDAPIEFRRFGPWAPVYVGSSLYVQRSIAKPLVEARRRSIPDVDKLLALMTEFAASGLTGADDR